MPRTVVQKTSFLGGEAGPLLEGRSDLAQFQLGARREQNFVSLKGGAATRRPGTRYVKNTANDKPGRIIPFIYSYDHGSDCYAVEITLATNTTLQFQVIRVSDNTVCGVANAPLTVDGTLINIDEIQYCQSADFLFLVHKSFPPQILKRVLKGSPDTFSLVPYIGTGGIGTAQWQTLPYLDENISTTTMAISAATVGTGRTLTFSAATLAGDATDVGKYFIQLGAGPTLGACVVTAAINTLTCTVTVLLAFGDTAAFKTWWEGAWSLVQGWPNTVCFYNQRLVFGGTLKKPDTFWMSRVGNYLLMSNTNAPFAINDPLNFQLASNRVNEIRWMVGGKKHTIGTSTSEWVGTVTNDGTNLFVQYDEETTHGSVRVQPQRSAYTIPFVQRSGQTIREMVFDFYSDSYQATDLNLFSSHIGTGYGAYSGNAFDVYIKAIAYQESPNPIMWILDSAGRLYGLTRDKQQNIAAWHSHVVGGVYGAFPANVISIAVIPSPNGRMDRIWMVVKRTINGNTVYHIEYIDDIKTNSGLFTGFATTVNQDIVDIRPHLDCATYAETGLTNMEAHNTASWAGITRFEGDTAYVVAYGASGINYCGSIAVDAGGNITLPYKAQSIVVGLNVNAEVRLLPLEGGDSPKINTRSIKRIDECAVKLLETYGLKVGKDRVMQKTGYVENTTSFEAIPFDFTALDPVSGHTATFTGFKEFQVPVSAETDAAFAFVMTEPWPCTILSVSSRVVTNEI